MITGRTPTGARERPRRWLPRNRKARWGAYLSFLLVFVALAAPVVSPHDPLRQTIERRLEPPSSRYPLGTDHLGRCLLSRILWGTRKTLLIAGVAGLVSLLIGTFLGVASGYLGGWIDQLITAVTDFLLAFPFFLVAIVLAGAFGQGTWSLLLALIIAGWTLPVRIVRSIILVERERDYVQAARALGTGRGRIILRHLLPQVWPQAVVLGALGLGEFILAITGLGFLGLGPPPPIPEWGSIVHDGRFFLRVAPHLALFPALATALAVLAMNLLGEGLQEQWTTRALSTRAAELESSPDGRER
ncbi:MAG: ABC transporter permease [Planctomycetota bacterium]